MVRQGGPVGVALRGEAVRGELGLVDEDAELGGGDLGDTVGPLVARLGVGAAACDGAAVCIVVAGYAATGRVADVGSLAEEEGAGDLEREEARNGSVRGLEFPNTTAPKTPLR